jgi:hypothetical protein
MDCALQNGKAKVIVLPYFLAFYRIWRMFKRYADFYIRFWAIFTPST